MSKRSSKRQDAREAKKKKEEAEKPSLDFDADWELSGAETLKGIKPLLYLEGPGIKPSEKIAAFDLDWTLIETASGRKFPTGPKDWKIFSDKVIPKLKAVYEDGYKIIIFSNQGGIEKKKSSIPDTISKFIDIISKIGIPIQVFISTGESHFRKPATGMWDFMVKNCNSGVNVDLGKCYYVGDAAGRAKNWSPGKPKDFSCSDRLFAVNIGIDFFTPEEYFDGQPPVPWSVNAPDPADFLLNAKGETEFTFSPRKGQELVLMVGAPASGKSTACKRYLDQNGYLIVNRDTLKTKEKCIQVAKNALQSGKSVVIDNTNPSKATRREFIDLAKPKKIPCRCLVMKTPLDLAHHMNFYRQSLTKGVIRRIPDVAYNMYKSQFEEPSVDEGFTEILDVSFYPNFESKKDEELFKKWTC